MERLLVDHNQSNGGTSENSSLNCSNRIINGWQIDAVNSGRLKVHETYACFVGNFPAKPDPSYDWILDILPRSLAACYTNSSRKERTGVTIPKVPKQVSVF